MESEEILFRRFSETPISEDFKRRLLTVVLRDELFSSEDSGSFIFWDMAGEFSRDVSAITV